MIMGDAPLLFKFCDSSCLSTSLYSGIWNMDYRLLWIRYIFQRRNAHEMKIRHIAIQMTSLILIYFSS